MVLLPISLGLWPGHLHSSAPNMQPPASDSESSRLLVSVDRDSSIILLVFKMSFSKIKFPLFPVRSEVSASCLCSFRLHRRKHIYLSTKMENDVFHMPQLHCHLPKSSFLLNSFIVKWLHSVLWEPASLPIAKGSLSMLCSCKPHTCSGVISEPSPDVAYHYRQWVGYTVLRSGIYLQLAATESDSFFAAMGTMALKCAVL